jgi:hypothetical protein
LLAVTIRVNWLVGFSVEDVLPSLVQKAGEAGLLKIAFSGFDIAVFSKLHNAQPGG